MTYMVRDFDDQGVPSPHIFFLLQCTLIVSDKEKWVVKLFDVLSQEKEYILIQQTLVNNWSCNISVSVYSLTLCRRTPWVPERVIAESTAYKRTSLKPRERKYSQIPLYKHPLNRDTSLSQFALSLGEKSPYISSKLNPLNTDTLLIWTILWPLSVRINGPGLTHVHVKRPL